MLAMFGEENPIFQYNSKYSNTNCRNYDKIRDLPTFLSFVLKFCPLDYLEILLFLEINNIQYR